VTIPAGDGVVNGSAFIMWDDGSSHSLRGLQVMISSPVVMVSDVAKNIVRAMKRRIAVDKETLERDENIEKAIPSWDKTWKAAVRVDKIILTLDEARLAIAKNMLTSTKTENTYNALCEMLIAGSWPQHWLNVITSATCDINGRYAVNVAPGHYYVFADFYRGQKYFNDYWCIPVTVQAGQTVRVNLTKDNILSAPQ